VIHRLELCKSIHFFSYFIFIFNFSDKRRRRRLRLMRRNLLVCGLLQFPLDRSSLRLFCFFKASRPRDSEGRPATKIQVFPSSSRVLLRPRGPETGKEDPRHKFRSFPPLVPCAFKASRPRDWEGRPAT